MTTTRFGRVSRPPHKFSPERVKFIDDFTDDEYDEDLQSDISSTVSYSEDEGPNEYKKDGFVVSDDDAESVGSTNDSWHPEDDEEEEDEEEDDDEDEDDMEEDFEDEDDYEYDDDDLEEEGPQDMALMLDEEEEEEEEAFMSWKDRAATIKQRVTGATKKVLDKSRTYKDAVTSRVRRAGGALRGLDERFMDMDFDDLDLEDGEEKNWSVDGEDVDPEEVMDLIFNNGTNVEEAFGGSRRKHKSAEYMEKEANKFAFQPYESDEEEEEDDMMPRGCSA
jgi:hypothetical protein